MHLELPKLRLHSLADFLKHYLMIVLSILTALALEAWIEHVDHARAAAAASASIEAELRSDLDDIRGAERINQSRLQPLTALAKLMTADLQAGQDAAAINRQLQAHRKDLSLSINWPIFASQAWDVAVANQSASWVDSERLRRYSGAYASLHDASVWLSQDSMVMLNAPRMMELFSRIDLGRDVDPLEALVVLREMISTSSEAQSHLRQLEPQLTQALAHPR